MSKPKYFAAKNDIRSSSAPAAKPSSPAATQAVKNGGEPANSRLPITGREIANAAMPGAHAISTS